MDKCIFIVRHGKIDNGLEKKYIGQTEIPLDNEGLAQAERLNIYFRKHQIECIYTSSLGRCIQTTQVIYRNLDCQLPLYTLAQLREINMGTWENRSFEEIRLAYPEAYISRGLRFFDYQTEDGESFSQVEERVVPILDEIMASDYKNILIVGHAGVNRVILRYLLKLDRDDIMKIPQSYGCITKLLWNQESNLWHSQYIKNEECLKDEECLKNVDIIELKLGQEGIAPGVQKE